MIKRIVTLCVAFIVLYIGLIQLQVFIGNRSQKNKTQDSQSVQATHKIYSFSFTKYTLSGEKEIEIEGKSANIFSRTVELLNVVAKAYAEEVPVTITADQGQYDKSENKVHLKKNVVATTEDGTRLLTEELDIHPSKRMMETEREAQVKKDNIDIEGVGAQGDSRLKKVKFKKNVTVVVQDPDEKTQGPTVITCDGPLIIDYEKNIAHFKDNVVAEDERGKLTADIMDVYYNKETRRVAKIIAIGNVVIENPDGNKTYSDNVIYLAEEGRIILGGDTEALYYEGDQSEIPKEIF
jgi:LPS export ABC transporter protein LptC